MRLRHACRRSSFGSGGIVYRQLEEIRQALSPPTILRHARYGEMMMITIEADTIYHDMPRHWHEPPALLCYCIIATYAMIILRYAAATLSQRVIRWMKIFIDEMPRRVNI